MNSDYAYASRGMNRARAYASRDTEERSDYAYRKGETPLTLNPKGREKEANLMRLMRGMNKKAQEEIVGFVLIVVIVSVILVILLAIFIRQPVTNERDSREAYQFLESAMEYTTDCAVSYEPDYSKIGELIGQCYSGGKLCTSGKQTCEVLNGTLEKMLDASFLVSEKAQIKGYEFKSEYIQNGTAPKEIIFIKEGNCSYNIRGADIPLDAFSGVITSSLKLCF